MITSLQRRFRSHPLALIIAGLFSFQASIANAIDYGVYDARALAMGGTVIAVGDTSQAVYYNPALLAFHEGDEDKTRDGRIYMPTLVAQGSTAIESAFNAVDDHLDSQLTDAINAYNLENNATNAGLVAKSSHDLRKVLDKVANKDLTLDTFIGFSASEPSDHEGGAFYMGVRTFGVGSSTVSKADLELLDEYIAAMDEIAQGTDPLVVAQQHPTLINNNGKLVDPSGTLNSFADISALVMAEWGLAVAKEFTFWDQPVILSITPKMMRVDAYRDTVDFNNTHINNVNDGVHKIADTKSSLTTLNADIGFASLFAEHYRIGVAVKDLFAKDFNTKQTAGPDLVAKLRPRPRLGIGYINDSVSLGLDYDLKESTPIANESASQEISLGAEYRVFDTLALRVGYRHDQIGGLANVMTSGIGYHGKRLVADIGYAHSSDMKGAGLQIGWAF